ncbi:TetR/AcrR family transcriptional regulator [Gordonia sp. (in: high G+C Gram-positive bacteria)]|uniref:TetR/AcrR family transcriptional regulator n=1 Tax=Gordonia sp. (in: high G+C Gram-positive bacteria) TaxID=84139 RepID=UPI003C762AE3
MSTPDAGVAVYRGQTLDDRIDERRKQLLDAAFTLLAHGGITAITMRAVARQASLSPRYFYESFADRSALLAAMFEQTMVAFAQAVSTAIQASATDPLSQTKAAIAAVTELLDSDPTIARLLQESLAEDALRDTASAAIPRFIEMTAGLLIDDAWYRTADPIKMRLDISALTGSLTRLFIDRSERRFDVSRDDFIDYCTGLIADLVQRRQSRR